MEPSVLMLPNLWTTVTRICGHARRGHPAV